QGEELVVAASVERELLDLMLIDDAGGFLRGEVNAGRRGADDDLLADRLDTESEVHLEALPDDKRDAALFLRGTTTAAPEPAALLVSVTTPCRDAPTTRECAGSVGESSDRTTAAKMSFA